VRLLVVEEPELVVRERGGLLDAHEADHEVGIDRDRRAADREVLQRTHGVHAVVRVHRHRAFAEQIVLTSKAVGSHRKTS
jgi:hypothetical protein